MQSPPRFRQPTWRYDQYLCVKPPLLLLLALVYLSRAITLPLIAAVGSLGGGTPDLTPLIRGLFGLNTLAPSAIAFAVVCAYCRRSPSGSRLARWIWARGQWLLTLSAVLDFFVTGSSLLHPEINDQMQYVLLAMAFDLYFLIYVVASGRIRAVFADFPVANDAIMAVKRGA